MLMSILRVNLRVPSFSPASPSALYPQRPLCGERSRGFGVAARCVTTHSHEAQSRTSPCSAG
jgi:hypothetical protein